MRAGVYRGSLVVDHPSVLPGPGGVGVMGGGVNGRNGGFVGRARFIPKVQGCIGAVFPSAAGPVVVAYVGVVGERRD